ncbi:hypothetical protein Ancab_028149 [Ancistrocladus abbreviatus]
MWIRGVVENKWLPRQSEKCNLWEHKAEFCRKWIVQKQIRVKKVEEIVSENRGGQLKPKEDEIAQGVEMGQGIW